jgi:uncharacterized protein (TIGR00255 family)
MLRSMTAYGRHATDTEFGELTCELRSVNHRYLDISLRLPDNLRGLEPLLRERASTRLHRGKVEIAVRIRTGNGSAATLDLDTAALAKLGLAMSEVESAIPDLAKASALAVLQWPGIISSSAAGQQQVNARALEAFDAALEDLIAYRTREGGNTAELLRNRAKDLSQCIAAVREHRPVVVARQRDKLVAKLTELDLEHDAQRLEQELVYAAQRLDIDEELDRLDHHVIELSQVLQRSEPVGRRLDFLMQEFNREANTLGSKAADIDTTDASVEVKVLIEQMREQVQNIE